MIQKIAPLTFINEGATVCSRGDGVIKWESQGNASEYYLRLALKELMDFNAKRSLPEDVANSLAEPLYIQYIETTAMATKYVVQHGLPIHETTSKMPCRAELFQARIYKWVMLPIGFIFSVFTTTQKLIEWEKVFGNLGD